MGNNKYARSRARASSLDVLDRDAVAEVRVAEWRWRVRLEGGAAAGHEEGRRVRALPPLRAHRIAVGVVRSARPRRVRGDALLLFELSPQPLSFLPARLRREARTVKTP